MEARINSSEYSSATLAIWLQILIAPISIPSTGPIIWQSIVLSVRKLGTESWGEVSERLRKTGPFKICPSCHRASQGVLPRILAKHSGKLLRTWRVGIRVSLDGEPLLTLEEYDLSY